jgi:hypothetical protein
MKPLPGVVNVMEELRDGDPRQAGSHAGGPSLAVVVATYGPLPVHSVLTLAAGLAEALSAAHAADVIHRDLSPASVLLTAGGPRLAGSGISRTAARWQPPPAGPLDFMAPELAAGIEAGPASDIFSLGAVLLYAATGAWMSHFAWHLDQLPGDLRPFIERCMAADPARRPSAAELRSELTAAYPGAVSHDAWLPPGIVAAGTRVPAPFGTPAAQKIRRHAGLIAIAALAFAVIVAGTVYVIHPWPYPVLRPAGLTADKRGINSVSLRWSDPTSGPLPDKYVILRNGTVAATVPGNVNHFKDGGLAPETKYGFRVIAYRGHARSEPSDNLYVVTQTPPLSEAVLDTYFPVTETIEAGADSVSGETDGQSWQDDWIFTGVCSLGPCVTQLVGSLDGQDFSAVLKASGGGSYTGTAQINDYWTCGTANYTDSTVEITVTPSSADMGGGQYQVVSFKGGLTWDIAANPKGNCGSAELVLGLTG